jgi:hypothetical protein
MAAGESARWEKDYPKQLAKVGNHTVISRIAAQLEYLKNDHTDPIIVARDNRIIREWHDVGPFHGIFNPDPRHRFFLARGLLHTREIWGDKRTIFLLGDVIYSNEIIEHIVRSTREKMGEVRFWLGKGEIFAIAIDWRAYDAMHGVMREVNEFASRQYGSVPIHTIGKAWHIYRLYNGLPLDSNSTKLMPTGFLVDDYTVDIDKLADYHKFTKEVIDTGILEEPNEPSTLP